PDRGKNPDPKPSTGQTGTKPEPSPPAKEPGRKKTKSPPPDEHRLRLPPYKVFDDSFGEKKAAFGAAKMGKMKGHSWEYDAKGARMSLKSSSRSTHSWPDGPYSDFACQLTAKVMATPSTEWGVIVHPATTDTEGIEVAINGLQQVSVRPSLKSTVNVLESTV